MISHLADPSNPAVAICGGRVETIGYGHTKTLCVRCWPPRVSPAWPKRIAGPHCRLCGQTAGHGFGCKGES